MDWLTVTWLPEAGVHVARELWDYVSAWCGGSVVGCEVPGLYGYAYGCSFQAVIHGSLVPIGRVDWGGERHGGRARFDLSGSGCSRVESWSRVHAFVAQLEDVTITRVDLAVDCLEGEFTVEDAVDWYEAGDFHAGGRRPRHSMPGDWLDPHYGRTFEVGRRVNGKMLRAYEKGRQLGDPDSPWTRFEVEIRNVDRVIPLDVLTRPDEYFAGAYVALARLLDVVGDRIRTAQAEGEISLGELVQVHRSAYGQLVSVLRTVLPAGEVLDLISRPGVPRRLHKSSLSGFLQSGSVEPMLQGLRQ